MQNNIGLAHFFGAARAAQVTSKLLVLVKGPQVLKAGWDGTVIERIVCASEADAAQEFDRLEHGLEAFVPAVPK